MHEIKVFQAVSGFRAVSSEKRIISGVSVITEGEAIGHDVSIDSKTLRQVKECAEEFMGGVKVKMDHWTGLNQVVGILRNFVIDGNQLRADLHLLKSSEATELILEIATEIPDTFGLSIVFGGVDEEIDGLFFARCDDLQSVDLVDRPAANPSGLFSQVDTPANTKAKIMADTDKTIVETIKEFFSEGKKGLVPAEQVTNLQTELSTVKASHATALEAVKAETKTNFDRAVKAETDLSSKIVEITNLKAAHATELATKEASVETRAAAKAGEIVASFGVKAVKGKGEAKDKKLSYTEQCIAANAAKGQEI